MTRSPCNYLQILSPSGYGSLLITSYGLGLFPYITECLYLFFIRTVFLCEMASEIGVTAHVGLLRPVTLTPSVVFERHCCSAYKFGTFVPWCCSKSQMLFHHPTRQTSRGTILYLARPTSLLKYVSWTIIIWVSACSTETSLDVVSDFRVPRRIITRIINYCITLFSLTMITPRFSHRPAGSLLIPRDWCQIPVHPTAMVTHRFYWLAATAKRVGLIWAVS